MSCSNCFNNCGTIVSDKCTKYTGASIPSLNISTGDTLLSVEENLSAFLLKALDGTGIHPAISSTIVCPIISLPVNPSLVDITTSLINAICDIKAQVDILISEFTTLDAAYVIPECLPVTLASKTHDVLQAVIYTLCGLNDNLLSFETYVSTHYVNQGDMQSILDAYMASISTANLMSSRMVPYTAIEFYGDITGKFDGSGAGIPNTDWENIYLCNGEHGTPDKRGVIAVGVTDVVGGGAYDARVDPGIVANPNYYLGDTVSGNNVIVLNSTMIPAHKHTATSVVTNPTHTHFLFNVDTTADVPIVTTSNYAMVAGNNGADNSFQYNILGSATNATLGLTSINVGIAPTVATTNADTGGGLSHSNIPPVLPCLYIMYIPTP